MAGGSVLVTGGAGYIGAHACKALAQAGFLPIALDDLSQGHEDFVRWGPLVRAGIADSAAVRGAIEEHQVQAVMHFAASALVGESVSEPAKYYANNVAGTLALLDGMRAGNCSKMVFSSTCAVYGQPERLPITEITPTNAVNPYGRSKLMCEQILQDYGAAYGLRSLCLRYFNAAGADQDGEIGERRDPETHLIPRALMALQGWIEDIQVFGSDFPTPDGTAVRDYVHVSDLAAAHVAALQLLLDGGEGGTLNLGAGQGSSVGQVLRTIAEVTGREFPAPAGPRRPGDPARLVADVSRAREVLGFEPRRSDLRTIVDTSWRWHQKAHPARAPGAKPGGGS